MTDKDKLVGLAGELPPYGFLYNSWIKSDAAKILCDATLIILAINEEVPFMFGHHASELVGQPVHILLPDALQEIHREHTARYVDRPRDRPMGAGGKLKGKTSSGKEFPVVIHLIRYHDKEKGLLIEATIRHADSNAETKE